MFNRRSKEKELMDLGNDFYTPQEYEHCLKTLFRVNQLMGFFKQTIRLLKRFPKNATVLDVGCGGGLFLLNLNRYYPNMSMLGIDISKEAIQIAQKELSQWKQKQDQVRVDFQLQDKAELSLAENSVDVILITLVCHHLEDEELITLLKQANAAARQSVIINDLQRHPIPYLVYKLFSSVFFQNRLITHDGLISILRGFTRQELKSLLQKANIPNYQIKWRFPFWWNILILKLKDKHE